MSTPLREKRLTWRSGGWILFLAIALTTAGTVWNLAPLLRPGRERPRGDGRTAASYGFTLEPSLAPPARIVSSGMVADALPALTDPAIFDAPAADAARAGRGRYLVPSDKVAGVVAGGAARAYPLRVLVWHEVVNDTVGGTPIAVTCNPLSGGLAVFDRRAGGETLELGVSGLLYQSGLLMYDRRPGHRGESLWSQLQSRAITGPAAGAGRTLAWVPLALCRWDDWRAAHPETTVLAPIPGEEEKYGQDVYGSYLGAEDLRFPVDPLPPTGPLPWKSRVLVTGTPGAWKVTPLAVPGGETRPEVVSPFGATPILGIYAFWFAWYATHADDPGTVAP
ncbi:MAG TPA: DUF3179 domain-containing (seleno)protein [Candidatus Polarisedimenticolaceae bacterium]|nr:DUF3179 domain-containing (seleno)protein [Candidatus Polarisedimenticolaceae bacterium]